MTNLLIAAGVAFLLWKLWDKLDAIERAIVALHKERE